MYPVLPVKFTVLCDRGRAGLRGGVCHARCAAPATGRGGHAGHVAGHHLPRALPGLRRPRASHAGSCPDPWSGGLLPPHTRTSVPAAFSLHPLLVASAAIQAWAYPLQSTLLTCCIVCLWLSPLISFRSALDLLEIVKACLLSAGTLYINYCTLGCKQCNTVDCI